MPVFAEGADLFFALGMLGDQQRFGFFPGPAAVLFDVPFMCADVGKVTKRAQPRRG